MTQRMVSIVIVDDDELQQAHMRQLVNDATQQLDININLTIFPSSEALLFAMEDHPEWELVFLDIEMGGMNGMEAARQIRQHNSDIQLVFATGYAEYAVEGYGVQALDYLLKPITSSTIERVLERFLNLQVEPETYVIFNVSGDPKRVNLSEILYLEALQGQVLVHLSGDVLTLNESLSQVTRQLNDRFIPVHRSYWVNLEAVDQLLKQDVLLTNGNKIPMSRRQSKDVQQAFIEFYRGKVFYHE